MYGMHLQVHISHVGQMRFKGAAEVQSVLQFSTAHLASRLFPADPPSAKADLVTLKPVLPRGYNLEPVLPPVYFQRMQNRMEPFLRPHLLTHLLLP